MSVIRLFQSMALKPHQALQLDHKASHHLIHVLRKKKGAQVILFNGDGCDYHSVISSIDKKGVVIQIVKAVSINRESPLVIELAQGIARSQKMDVIIQKAVELGVSRLIPLITERSQYSLKKPQEKNRLSRWQSVMFSACEQCGRNRIPTISSPQRLDAYLPQVNTPLRMVLSPYVDAKLPDHLKLPEAITLLIGPEGGFTDTEITNAQKHQFIPLSLGPRILRTETATIAALTLMQSRFGDL